MKKTFLSIWNWIVYSSADPAKVALTLKGLAGFIPSMLVLLSFVGVNGVTSLDLNSLFDTFSDAVISIFAAITGCVAAYGAIRKVWISVAGIVKKIRGL